jgi:hypothetical protein
MKILLDDDLKTEKETLVAVGHEVKRRGNRGDLILVKPAVGFILPWAGVTPAPGVKKRCGTSSLLERVKVRS